MSDVDYYDVQAMIRDARSEIRGEIDRAISDLRDDVLELGRKQERDVEALRESIRATDRVLNDRTAHLA